MEWEESGGAYKRLELPRRPKTLASATPEQKYWRRFKTTAVTKAYAAVHCVAFSPAAPYDFLSTNSTRVQIYGNKGKTLKRTISRFKDIVYTASFRGDGKLLVAGGEEKDLKVFDAGTGGMLRMMKGHTRAVHATGFSDDKVHLMSGGDDATVRFWDVSSGQATLTMEGHSDHVRCLASNPASSDVWASGSYDHTVRLWDVRSQGESVMSVNHGQPVQATLILRGGGVLVTAGGNTMKVWDLLGGGKLLQTMCNHSKPITCLAQDGDGGRLLSGSLDHHLKVYDVQEYKVRFSMDYTQPILAMGISPDRNTIAVGMSDGLLTVRSRPLKDLNPDQQAKRRGGPRAGTFHYFIRGQSQQADEDDYRVERVRKQRLQPYDKLLKAFNYGGALDAALATGQAQVVASVLQELYVRDGVRLALSGRDVDALLPILKFLCKHITDSHYTALLTDTSMTLLDLYTVIIGRSELVDELLVKLRWRVHEQVPAPLSHHAGSGVPASRRREGVARALRLRLRWRAACHREGLHGLMHTRMCIHTRMHMRVIHTHMCVYRD